MEFVERAKRGASAASHLFDDAGPAPLDVLKRVYGYSAFRGRQEEVVEHVTELRNALDSARAILGLSAIVHPDPTINAGSTPIRATHFTSLRNAVK